MGNVKLKISGMHCSACSTRIERVVSSIDGVGKAEVNLASEQAFITYEEQVTIDEIKKKINSLGFKAKKIESLQTEFLKKEEETNSQIAQMKSNLIWKFVFVIPLFYISMGEMLGLKLPFFLSPDISPLNYGFIQLFLTLPIIWFGRHFYTLGLPALIRKSPNMDSLIAIGTGAAFIYSLWNLTEIMLGIDVQMKVMDLYFESVGVLITLVSLGKYFEVKAKLRSTGSIKKLLELTPKFSTRLIGDKQETISVDDIEPGDTLLVKPGEKIPADGVIVKGGTSVNEAMLTGESMFVTKNEGDSLYGGTVNHTDRVYLKVTKAGEDSVLASIIRMVQDAQGSKAPIARIADKVSFYFIPTVIIISVFAGSAWYLFSDVGFAQSLRFAIAVLVISCPCAMGLATPISIMVGTGRGAQLGVLIKNGEVLEKMAGVQQILLDKTGTITRGKPAVTSFQVYSKKLERDKMLMLIGSLEQSSEHPLAESVLQYCSLNNIELAQPNNFRMYSGQGVSGEVDNHEVIIGNLSFLKQRDIIFNGDINDSFAKEAQGETVLYFSIDGEFSGFLTISDPIKDEANQVVKELTQRKISTTMITGDNQRTASAIAMKAGVKDVIAQVLPAQKLEIVKKIKGQGKLVAMVGDGINDAPALTEADLGIAMGTGIDIAVESGDIVLVSGDLRGILTAIQLSKAVMTNIKQNLFWAFGFNIIGIPIAAGALVLFGGPALNPMFAGMAMAMSSVAVVTNGLRLRSFSS